MPNPRGQSIPPVDYEALSQGQRANLNGARWEELMMFYLLNFYHFKEVSIKTYYQAREAGILPSERVFIRNAPYRSIYGKTCKTEFLLASTDNKAYGGFRAGTPKDPMVVRVECKRQESLGSVDEKFAHLILNAEQALSERVWQECAPWLDLYARRDGSHQDAWNQTYGYPEDHVLLLMEIPGASADAQRWVKEAVEHRDYWDRARLPNKTVAIENLATTASRLSGLFHR